MTDPGAHRLIVSADLHAHNYRTHSHITPEGYNSRLLWCTEALRAMDKYIMGTVVPDIGVSPSVNMLLVGDFLHSRIAVDILVAQTMKNTLGGFEGPIRVLASVGNHDLYFRRGHGIGLKLFEPELEIAEGSYRFSCKKLFYQVYAIPYTQDIVELRKRLKKAKKAKWGERNILMLHHGIAGAAVGPHDYKLKEELTTEELSALGYDWVFAGHYHTHQDLGYGIVIPGSPLQHDFGDRDKEKGFLDVDLVEDTYDFIPVDAPRFVQVELDSGELPKGWKKAWKGNYVKLVFSSLEHYRDFEDNVSELREAGVLSVIRVIRERKGRQSKGSPKEEFDAISVRSSIKPFVRSRVKKRDRGSIIDVGMLLLEMAEQEDA